MSAVEFLYFATGKFTVNLFSSTEYIGKPLFLGRINIFKGLSLTILMKSSILKHGSSIHHFNLLTNAKI